MLKLNAEGACGFGLKEGFDLGAVQSDRRLGWWT